MEKFLRWAQVLQLVFLAACNNDDDPLLTPANPDRERGALLQDPTLVRDLSSNGLLALLGTGVNALLPGVSGAPDCDVAVYRIQYQTIDGRGEPTSATAAVMAPHGSDARCSGPRPLVLYAHGTTTDRAFDIAALDNGENAEGLLMAVVFAAQGYIVVAPNYVGYGGSSVTSHPYLIADAQAADMIDALAAARTALPVTAAAQTDEDGRLFITGYSQGGYVAMATHRALQSQGRSVTASAPMSGPYALAAFVDAVFFGRVNSGAPVYISFLLTAHQRAYGGIYNTPPDVFADPYASGIDTLLPTTLGRGELYTSGRLPRTSLFSPTPPQPDLAPFTPATTPAEFAPIFARGFGADFLIRNDYRLAYLRDAQSQPDRGWPTVTTGEVAENPLHPWRRTLRQNDLRSWVPAAPVLLCGGHGDPTVFWFNTELMQQYWTQRGAPSTLFTVLDIDSPATAADPYAAAKGRFANARDTVASAAVLQGATDNGVAAVSEAYHSTLVPPFCLAAVREFFAAR